MFVENSLGPNGHVSDIANKLELQSKFDKSSADHFRMIALKTSTLEICWAPIIEILIISSIVRSRRGLVNIKE